MPRTRKYQTNSERQAAYRLRCAQAGKVSATFPPGPSRRRWKAIVNAALALLYCAAGEMQDCIEAHSETWQESQAGESLTEMLESVQDASAALEDIQHQTRQANLP
jgi:hypothetical protein